MDHDAPNGSGKVIYKVVLTGGPCGGKTTSLARITTFFENLGWKVYRINEAAYIYMNGGLVFPDLPDEGVYQFQKNLIYSMLQIERTFDDLARIDLHDKILIVCDRGVMDATAYMKDNQWAQLRREEGWSETELRDRRYNQVIHMVSVAKGAPSFYSLSGHGTRHESLDEACKLDEMVANAWVGHPYFDVMDNTTNFEEKIKRMLQCICVRLGVDATDRLAERSHKIKFLVKSVDNNWNTALIKTTEFRVVHHFLAGSISESEHTRIRCRGSTENDFTYVQTTRGRCSKHGEVVETKRPLDKQTYMMLLHSQQSRDHAALHKTRHCFLWDNQYFQLDIFATDLCPSSCSNLILLETFSAKDASNIKLPPFLQIEGEVTGECRYRLFNLASHYRNRNGDGCFESAASSKPQSVAVIGRRKEMLSNVMKGSFNMEPSSDAVEFSKPMPDSPTK